MKATSPPPNSPPHMWHQITRQGFSSRLQQESVMKPSKDRHSSAVVSSTWMTLLIGPSQFSQDSKWRREPLLSKDLSSTIEPVPIVFEGPKKGPQRTVLIANTQVAPYSKTTDHWIFSGADYDMSNDELATVFRDIFWTTKVPWM